MSFLVVRLIALYLTLFASLGLGLALSGANKSQVENDNAPTNASLTSTTLPTLIRAQRASPTAVLHCLAPSQLTNGEWKLHRDYCDNGVDCNVLEGSSLQVGSQLLYRCDSGYEIEGNSDVYCGGRGKWSPIPKCTEVRCASLNSVSTTVSCTRFGDWVSCDSPVPPHTRAEVSCRRGYEIDTRFISSRRAVVNCKANGDWDPEPIRCVPVCGLAITHQQPFISGGTPANVGDFPWHATLYQEVNSRAGKEKVFICGATIIQTNLLLTAAHCVWDETYRTKQDPRKLFVATGNVFRDYDSPLHNPEIVRKAAVKNVYTHCNFYGLTGNYVSDIALLELHSPFELSSILLPACLDASQYRDQFLEPGLSGKVAGFGNTDTGVPSGNLQTLTLPYISFSQCKTSNDAAQNEPFISSDKFCAGYNNGSAVCEGDSGGGLVFKKGGLWYVMGIVSVGLGVDVTNGERSCNKYSYSLYTKVSLYMSWIQDVLIYVERNQTYPACTNEQTTTETSTRVTVKDVSGCLAPPQPADGKWKLHQYSCHGRKDCLVSEGTMLETGSQLVYSCDAGIKIRGPTQVSCGRSGEWTTIPTCTGDPCSTKSGSSGVCTLLKSCEPALVRLRAGSRPENICRFADREPIVCCPITTNMAGTTTSPAVVEDLESEGRGKIEDPNHLMKTRTSTISDEYSKANYPLGAEDSLLPKRIVSEWMICTEARDRETCQGDSGGPLVVSSKMEHCMYDLIGITSHGRACGAGYFGLYTRVYHYIPWIESIVWPQG